MIVTVRFPIEPVELDGWRNQIPRRIRVEAIEASCQPSGIAFAFRGSVIYSNGREQPTHAHYDLMVPADALVDVKRRASAALQAAEREVARQ